MTTTERIQQDVGGYASSGVTRVLCLSLEAAALILLVLSTPNIIQDAASLPTWWTTFAVGVIALPAIVMFVFARAFSPTGLRRLGGVQAIGILVAMLWLVGLSVGHPLPPTDGTPWPVGIAVVAGSAGAICWGITGAIVYNVALQATVFSVVAIVVDPSIRDQAFGDAIIGVFYVTLFATLAVSVRRAGVLLDGTVASAILDARTAAAAEARRGARRRVASLVHDSVIVALLTYANGADIWRARAEATRALRAIWELDADAAPVDRTPIELAWELQALTTEQDPATSFDYRVSDDTVIPAAAAAALLEAASESLRNSVQHANPQATAARQVVVTITRSAVEVILLDDGLGFDPEAIEPTRLGIRRGIVARMDGIEGGSAQITSKPGYGTIVILRWSRS
jgi:hypothetical protein